MTNETKLTAVEWLVEKLSVLTFDYVAGFINKQQYDEQSQKVIKEAKEMEKHCHAETWVEALDYGIKNLKGLNDLSSEEAFEQYYNETYGGNK